MLSTLFSHIALQTVVKSCVKGSDTEVGLALLFSSGSRVPGVCLSSEKSPGPSPPNKQLASGSQCRVLLCRWITALTEIQGPHFVLPPGRACVCMQAHRSQPRHQPWLQIAHVNHQRCCTTAALYPCKSVSQLNCTSACSHASAPQIGPGRPVHGCSHPAPLWGKELVDSLVSSQRWLVGELVGHVLVLE